MGNVLGRTCIHVSWSIFHIFVKTVLIGQDDEFHCDIFTQLYHVYWSMSTPLFSYLPSYLLLIPFSFLIVSHLLFLCVWDWSLNSEIHACKLSALPLEPNFKPILLYPLSQTSSPFCSGYFGDGVSQDCWPRTAVFPISAFQVARITSMSYRCPASPIYFHVFFFPL
jgi:hypothetical protein